MNLSQITGIGALPFGRFAGVPGFEFDGPDHRVAGRFRAGFPRLFEPQPAPERTSRPRVPHSRATGHVLPGKQFERALGRERSLADRGTRRFSLLVLRRRAGIRDERRERRALTELAQQISNRLRCTDLVGRPDADRVEALLTDTEPAGAHVVAVWVEQLEAILQLDLELTIYVYPTVTDSGPDRGSNGSPRSFARPEATGAPGNGHPARPGQNTMVSPAVFLAEDLAGTNGRARGGRSRRWPMEDLWPRLGHPTPLWKRSLDIVISSVALMALSPLFLVIAIAVRLDSAGPVFFKHMRAGRGGRPFAFYKFRSMIADAEERRAALASRNEKDGPIFKIREDPRVTRVGRLLRRWSLDELPQLWNVLKGDISLVGPRSPTFDEVAQYERWHRRRLSVIGGITCTWQVSGRSEISFREWMRLDMKYIACRNLWNDLRLLALTLPAVVSGRGAC